MATPTLSYQNKFSTTLSAGITASDTTISLTSLPTPSEGYLVIEPDSSTAWEEIYYTSKTGSAVVCPSAAAGRGQNGSTAASHSSGATVRMDTTAGMFLTLQDATALTGVHTNNTNYGFDFVASGCVWTADAAGSTRVASMTSGVVYINGRRHTVAAVTSRTFTASKDVYVDLLYSTTDNIATPVNTDTTTNAASPALASNSVRLAIVVVGASSIATAASINQGQEDRVLPIASSIPYTVTDSLGNLICPRDPDHKILGYRQIVTAPTGTTIAQVTGLSCPVLPPAGRKVRITVYTNNYQNSGANINTLTLWNGVVNSGTQLQSAVYSPFTGTASIPVHLSYLHTPGSGLITYNVGSSANTGTWTVTGASTAPAFVMVELV